MSYDQTYSQSYYGVDAPGLGSDGVDPVTNPALVPIVTYFPENPGPDSLLTMRPGVTEQNSTGFLRYVQDRTDSEQWNVARALVTYIQDHAQEAWAAARRDSKRDIFQHLKAVDDAIRDRCKTHHIFNKAQTLGFESESAFECQYTEHVGTPPTPMQTLLCLPQDQAAGSAYGGSSNDSHETSPLATGQNSTSAYGMGQMSIQTSDYPTDLSYRRKLLEDGQTPSETPLSPGQHPLRYRENAVTQAGPSWFTPAYGALPRSSTLPASTVLASPIPDKSTPGGLDELEGKHSSAAEAKEGDNDLT